jgi:hypothetical protein
MSVPALTVFADGPVAVDADNLNTFVQTAQTANQLRTLTGVIGMTVMLQGIAAPGDGLGGFFFWNAAATAADDNLNTLVPNGSIPGAWLRLEIAGQGSFQPLLTPGQLNGTTTNDNALAGNVGEFVSSTVLLGAAVPLTTATAANVTSISLTPGDWDVWGTVAYIPGVATTYQSIYAWINTVSATAPTVPDAGAENSIAAAMTTGATQILPTGMTRISIAVTTTVYLGAYANFGVSTLAAYGFIGARRAR